MFRLSLIFLVALFVIVPSHTFSIKERNPNYEMPAIPILKSVEKSASTSTNTIVESANLSQVIVLQIHYDCQGNIIRQEASKLKFLTGLLRIPGEEDLYIKVYNTLEPMLPASRENNKDVNGNTSPDSQTQAPVSFKSMIERMRGKPKSSRTPMVEERTYRPLEEEDVTNPFKIIFKPDRIIDVPVRSCPSGENEDKTGKCRPKFPERLQVADV